MYTVQLVDSGSIRFKRTSLSAQRLEMKVRGWWRRQQKRHGHRPTSSSPASKISQPNPEAPGWEIPALHNPPACARDKSSWTGVQSTRDKALRDEGMNEDGGSSSQTQEMGGNVRAQQPRLWARGKKERAGSWRGTRDGICQEGSCLLSQRSFCL